MPSISFTELVPNGYVTVTEDGMLYAVELVMVVTGKDRIQANNLLYNLKEEHFCSQKLLTRKMKGTGNGRCKLINFEHAIELIMVLPGDRAKEYRHKFADIIKRYLAGDMSLISEIQGNAVSDAPVNKMARDAVQTSWQLDDIKLKRKREELELQKMESDIKLNELKAEMDMKYAAIDRYQTLCTDTTMDERAKLLFKDSLLNSTLIGGGRITNGVEDDHVPISLSQMGAKLGYHLSTDEYKKVGKIVAKLYREANGTAPSKHTQLVNGQAMEVNTYLAKDADLVKQALEQYALQACGPRGPV